ncbi:MAG: hypothetical protein E7773_13290 [Sphingomonas sp.]|uniref:hypothetical protein n=1 Tax=Sphingomonas sp. TaxID=28214 RepID=UPI0012251CDB|nr:hypothetical protein [Sphingomonas sp.]THD35405.1 MAG: hypothetical protein E7773_13290 [Sphingomonas sp.]
MNFTISRFGVLAALVVTASPVLIEARPFPGDGVETHTDEVRSRPAITRSSRTAPRQHLFKWPLPITLRSGIWSGSYAQRVKGLSLTAIEQIDRKSRSHSTSYIVDFDYFNQTEDDKGNQNRIWTFKLFNKNGIAVDNFTIDVEAICSKQGYHHFNQAVDSRKNFFEIITYVTVMGTKPRGYEGGCGYPGGD